MVQMEAEIAPDGFTIQLLWEITFYDQKYLNTFARYRFCKMVNWLKGFNLLY